MAWIESRKLKRGGMAYYVISRVNGVRVSEPAGPIFQTAKAIKREIENKQANRNWNPKQSTSLREAFQEYETLIKQTRSSKTWQIYNWALKKLIGYVTSERDIESIKNGDLIKFRAIIMKDHSVNGILNIIKILKSFFSFCIDCKYIQINPASGLSKGIKELKVAIFLEDAHIRHILDCIKNPNLVKFKKNQIESKEEFSDIVKTVLLTGLRQGDISALKQNFIKDNKIFIPKGKGDKPRVVPINKKLMPILEKYMIPGREFIFQGWNEKHIRSTWSRIYTRAQKSLSGMPLRCRFHDLRHTFASNYLRGGGTLADLQIILGHSNIKTTVRYAHFQESDLVTKMEKVKSDFLEDIPPQFQVA